MDLTHDEVLEILQLIERSKVDYLELQVGETRIVADRTGRGPRATEASSVPPAVPTEVPAAPAPPPAATAPVAEPVAPSASEAAVAAPADGTAEDLHTITAPVVGVFYRAPEPGAAPYIEVGTTVAAGATVGLVEVMKMFNGVTADVSGEVVEILAENEEFVEFGQPLVRIRPETSA